MIDHWSACLESISPERFMERLDTQPVKVELTSRATKVSRGKFCRGISIAFLLLLILYPLSLGPVSYLQIRGFLPSFINPQMTASFYRPLWNYSNSKTSLAATYKSYVDWWIVKGVEQDLQSLSEFGNARNAH